MKAVLFALLTMTTILATAQPNAGTVTYKYSIRMDFDMDGEKAEIFKNLDLPEEQVVFMELLFTEKASLFRAASGITETEYSTSSDNMSMKFKMSIPQDEWYQNLATGETVELREFMGRKFLIDGEKEPLSWKVSPEQKKVQGYLCQKAVLQDTSRTVVAWFTLEIPVAVGPRDYNGLPGLILEVDINEGESVLSALEVDLTAPASEELQAPDKGKKVSRERYDQIVEEKKTELEALNDDGNATIIIRRQ